MRAVATETMRVIFRRAQFISFRNKANGWFTVAAGADPAVASAAEQR
jgi:hypothetical protein